MYKNENIFFPKISEPNNLNKNEYIYSINKPSLLIENIRGNFIKEGNIILDINNGLNLFNSINKNGKFYFGENCRDVIIINLNI